MKDICIDSDIIIDYTRGANKLLSSLLLYASQKNERVIIPSVVVAELMAGTETKNDIKREYLEELFNKVTIAEMDYEISKLTGFLIRDYRSLNLADAIVAATALTKSAKLATRNKKHFSQIPRIKFFDLKDLA